VSAAVEGGEQEDGESSLMDDSVNCVVFGPTSSDDPAQDFLYVFCGIRILQAVVDLLRGGMKRCHPMEAQSNSVVAVRPFLSYR